MLDSQESQPGGAAQRNADPLSHIARLLNCDVETFTHRLPGPIDVEGTSELLKLWAGLTDPAERTKILDFIRQLTPTS